MAKRRPSGDGMVRKREDGRWEGRIVVGHKENGEPIFRYVLAKTQKELLAKLHRDMDLYQDAQLTEDSRMTLGEWLDRWMEEYGAVTLRPNTLRSYEQYIRCYVKPYLGGKIVSRVTRLDIQKLYRKLKKEGRVHDHPEYGHELSDSMVLRIHAMLHRCLKDAERDHIVPPITQRTVSSCPRATTNQSRFSTVSRWMPFWRQWTRMKSGETSSTRS